MRPLFFLAISLFSINLLALEVPMIDVVAEAEPASTGYINLEVDPANSFLSLSFKDETESKNVLMKDLIKKKVSIVNKGPVDVILVSAQSLSKSSMILNIHYLYQFKLFNSIYKTKQLKMYYVAPTNLFETVDVDTNKVVVHAYGYSNIIDGEMKGISRIETW